jgi:hypothetical protein
MRVAHDVFISYSKKDKQVADALCAALESERIRCWLAPRDIRPGADWASEIVKAVESSRAMVLVFSESSAESTHVRREITAAANGGVIIVPLKIDATDPTGAMQYYLADTHWLDAVNPPTTEQIAEVVRKVAGLLDVEYDASALVIPKRAKPKRWVLAAAIVSVAAIALAGIGAYLVLRGGADSPKSPGTPNVVATQQAPTGATSDTYAPSSAPSGTLDTVGYAAVAASLPKGARSSALEAETTGYLEDAEYEWVDFQGTWEGHDIKGTLTFQAKWHFLNVAVYQFDDVVLKDAGDAALQTALKDPEFSYFYETVCQNPAGAKITAKHAFAVGDDNVRTGDKLTFDGELRLVRTSW